MKNPFKKVFTAHIFMKSGNVLILDKVSEINIKYIGNEIMSLNISQSKKVDVELFAASLALDQIEAIVRRDQRRTLFY